MKNLIYLLFALFIFSNCTFAQTDYIIGVYSSIPMGNFGSTDPNEEAGYAKTGWGVMVEQQFNIGGLPKQLKLWINLSYHFNALDIEALEKSFYKSFQGVSIKIKDTENNYNPLTLAVGPSYHIEFSDIIDFELKAGIGVMFTNIDPIVIKAYDIMGAEVLNELIAFQSQGGFAYFLGSSFGIKTSNSTKFSLFGQYASSKESVSSSFENQKTFDSDFNISYLNLGVSFKWNFN